MQVLVDKGVNAILFSGLDDVNHIRRVSAENDSAFVSIDDRMLGS
jgi:hypothetical protein